MHFRLEIDTVGSDLLDPSGLESITGLGDFSRNAESIW